MPATNSSDIMRQLLAEMRKAAATKSAVDDPGGADGASSHPTAKADNSTLEINEGERGKENDSEINDQVPNAVPEATPVPPGEDKQESLAPSNGLNATSTGKDPEIEDGYKDKKDDPGTTHPAKAAAATKYAEFQQLSFAKHAQTLVTLREAVLEALAGGQKLASVAGAPATSVAAAPAANAEALKTAAKAGYALAAGAPADAHQEAVRALVANTIYDGEKLAMAVVGVLQQSVQEINAKAAADGDDMTSGDPGEEKPPLPGGHEGGPPPGADAGGGGLPPDLLAASAGAPGLDAPPGAGGPPAGPEEAIHEFMAAMMDMGITPEEVMEIAKGMGSGGGGMGGGMGGPPPPGGPMGAGGPPPDAGMGGPPPDAMPKAAAEQLYKAAHAARNLRRSGKFEYTAPKTARATELRRQMRSYLAERLTNVA